MTQQLRDVWIQALRSKEYKQTRGALRDKVGYCCLGVLCDLYQHQTGQGQWEQGTTVVGPDDRKPAFAFTAGGEASYKILPRVVREAVGLPDSMEHILANRNDSGYSFRQLATYIERYVTTGDF